MFWLLLPFANGRGGCFPGLGLDRSTLNNLDLGDCGSQLMVDSFKINWLLLFLFCFCVGSLQL
jgi:hypothetical protein